MEKTIAEEQNTAFGQWLQKRQMRGYARAFILAGMELVDEATESGALTDVEKLAELGVKNKKHLRKLAKLAKSVEKTKKKKSKGGKKDDL